MEKFKQRWGVSSNLDIVLIFIVFSINGSFAAFIARPFTEFLGINRETMAAWTYWPIRILVVFLVYQTTLPLVGWCFGQFKFFWAMEKKMLKRMGLSFLFKEEE